MDTYFRSSYRAPAPSRNNLAEGAVKMFHRGVLSYQETRKLLGERGLDMLEIVDRIGPAIDTMAVELL